MTLRIVDIDSLTQVALLATDDVYVAAGVVLNVAGDAIVADDSGHSALIAGKVSASNFGVRLGNDAFFDASQSVEITKSGSVYGDFVGVLTYGGNSNIVNQGVIAGGSYGILFSPGNVGTRDTITNSGTILGEAAIFRNSGSYVGDIDVFNSGTIIGRTTSFDSTSALNSIDRIYNKGRMDGNISLDGGNDLYDGRGGTLKGTAFGEAGDDTFIGGNGVERFNGGLGADKFTGGLGKDVLTMGTGVGDGIDKIIFNAVTEIGDIVTDFTTSDFFQFKKAAFGNLALGTLSTAAYWENTTGVAHDASDRFIFETDTSRLWYDRDGTGSAAKVLVADMSNTVNISNADIQII